jgi:hypothetical protein
VRISATWERAETFRYIAIIGSVSALGLLFVYWSGLHGGLPLPVDRNGVPLGRDFLNTWFYGRAFFDPDPGRFYDRDLYVRTVHSVFPQDAADRLWSYPPPFLIVAAPFGCLSNIFALAVWSFFGLAALGLAVHPKGSGWLILSVLTSPMVVYSLIAGQVSLIVAALLLTAFAQLDRRPVVAGFLLSILIIKPQTAFLVPVLLMASRRWTVLLAAAAGVLFILALSVALNGSDVWMRYFNSGVPAQMAEMRSTIDVLAPISASVTTAAVRAGLTGSITTTVQVLASCLALALVVRTGVRGKAVGMTPEYEGLVVLAGSVLATPYFLIHDLVAFSALTMIVAYREGLIRNRFFLLFVLYAPIMASVLSMLNIYILPWLALAFALWLASRRVVVAQGTGSETMKILGGPWASLRSTL